MTRVCESPSPILSNTRSKPSESVLSKKKMSIGSSGEPRAADTNCGPQRGAADPNVQHVLEAPSIFRGDLSGVNIFGECLDAPDRLFDFPSEFPASAQAQDSSASNDQPFGSPWD